MQTVGIIPARYASTRFPGKMLAPVLGISLIQRTYENAKKCQKLQELYVATDDERIFDHVKAFQGQAIMTSPDCLTGTDRLAESLKKEKALESADIIVNIQGDEPLVHPETIGKVAQILENDPQAVMSTAIVKIESKEELLSPSIVKCVIDQSQNALYFSRNLIPAGKALSFQEGVTYYRHIGLYAYRKDFLMHYAELSPTPLQIAEDLEQLKVLEHGFRIKAAIVAEASLGVDVPEDIKKVEEMLCKQNTFS